MLNKKLAKRVYTYLKAHPEKHNQSSWVGYNGVPLDGGSEVLTEQNMCKTTMCVAGTAVYLEEGVDGLRFMLTDGDWTSKGADLLGLDYDDAFTLFYNTDNEGALNAVLAIANGDEQGLEEILEEYE